MIFLKKKKKLVNFLKGLTGRLLVQIYEVACMLSGLAKCSLPS